jgi:TRAP-type C4-dicarboxylate transport system permease small subunit
MRNILRLLDGAIAKIVKTLLILSVLVMLTLAAVQVILRILFHSGISWGDVAARHLVLWTGFFGAYLATREHKHFRIDAFIQLLPTHWRRRLILLTDFFAMAVCIYLSKASINFLNLGIDAHSTPFLGIPERYLAIIVPVGFVLLSFQFLVQIIDILSSKDTKP